DEIIMPDPVLVGGNMAKLEHLKSISGVEKITTDLEEVLNDPYYQIYFDSQTTGRRASAVKRAIKAGKHIYCEKPVGISTEEVLELFRLCQENNIKNGVVQYKLWLPGKLKFKRLKEQGFFGKILS